MGAKTIFFDVNLASNDKKYLKITESRFAGEGNDRVRSSVVLFPENIEGFEKSLKEMAGYLNWPAKAHRSFGNTQDLGLE